MTDLPEDELAASRAALAPTLAAVAAILPWLAKPQSLRFAPELNQRWIEACKNLADAWTERHGAGESAIRPAIFALYHVALESADIDCLRLGEALASAADQLESRPPSPRLTAALAASIECLNDKAGLEHPTFPERASHFARRLESMSLPDAVSSQRSLVLDRLFVAEANEYLERMQDALALLPPDAYALKSAAIELAQAAENLELFGVMHLARELAASMNARVADLDGELARSEVEARLRRLAETIAAVNA